MFFLLIYFCCLHIFTSKSPYYDKPIIVFFVANVLSLLVFGVLYLINNNSIFLFNFLISIASGRDTDGFGVFMIDPHSGMIRTRSALDHEDRSVYRVAVAATDKGQPPKQTVRILRIEVLDLNDNRPTFTSSSLVFKVNIFP